MGLDLKEFAAHERNYCHPDRSTKLYLRLIVSDAAEQILPAAKYY